MIDIEQQGWDYGIKLKRQYAIRNTLESTELFANRYATYFLPSFKYLNWYKHIENMRSKFKLILVHPGAGKSTLLKWEAIRRITKDRNYKVAYISKSSKKAALFMESIGKELKQNELLIKEHGEFYEHGAMWNTETIKVKGSGADATPTISNYGVTTQIEGMRPDMIILDDPIDINTVLSPAECDSMIARFPTWIQRLHISPNSEMWVIGHRFSTTDLYSAIEQNKAFDTLILQAYVEGTQDLLVPEFWDWEQFSNMVLGVHRDYELQAHYQQRLVNPENCALKWDWLEGNIIDVVPSGELFALFDPATTIKKGSDYSAGAVGCKYEDGVLVTALERWKINSGWERVFVGFAQQHGARDMYIETNNTQTLEDSTRNYIRDNNINMAVTGFKTTERDKNYRIGTLEVPARNGQIFLHRSIVGSAAWEDFKTQWIVFPNIAHDDLLDVVQLLWARLEDGGYGAGLIDMRGF